MNGALAWALAGALALASGCGSKTNDDHLIPPPASPISHLTGVFVSSDESGMLDVTLDTGSLAPALRASGLAGASVTAHAVMSLDGGGVVILSGTYDTATDSLRVSGGGHTVEGLYLPVGAPPRMEGRFTAPSGNGAFVALKGGRSSVHVFCCTYENTEATLWGTINLAVSGAYLTGVEVEDGGSYNYIEKLGGSVSGTGLVKDLAFAGTTFQGSGQWDTVKGQPSGTWTAGGQSGVWSGAECLPGTTGSE